MHKKYIEENCKKILIIEILSTYHSTFIYSKHSVVRWMTNEEKYLHLKDQIKIISSSEYLCFDEIIIFWNRFPLFLIKENNIKNSQKYLILDENLIKDKDIFLDELVISSIAIS